MKIQKDKILSYVSGERQKGRTVSEILRSLKISKSSYYRWKNPKPLKSRIKTHTVTPEEYKKITETKEQHPGLRHRQIQGLLQQKGHFISASVVYQHLKSINQVEHYERRSAPWKEPFYEIYRANTMWGADWSQLRIGGRRWYLLTLIDFFSRLIIQFEVVPTVHSGLIKNLYEKGISSLNISTDCPKKPELRLDQGSPNTSRVTKEFFKNIGADLSYASVRRPTENALTERFYRTIKQEEIYLVGDYQDEQTAKEELSNYITWYNDKRPHQALWNFTPRLIHETNNKTKILQNLKDIKQKSWIKRKEYWSKNQLNCCASQAVTSIEK